MPARAVAERLGVKRPLNASIVIVSNPFGLPKPRLPMGDKLAACAAGAFAVLQRAAVAPA